MKKQADLKRVMIPIIVLLLMIGTGITAVAVRTQKKMAEMPESSADGTTIVHYYNTNNWNSVDLYYYQSGITTPKWPGVAMQSEGDKWFKYEITDADAPRVIFSNNGSSQDPGANKEGYSVSGEMWYKNGKWYESRPLDLDIVVNFCKPDGWNAPNIYYYLNDKDTGPKWPGEKMKSSGNGWYKHVISKYSQAKVLFNDGVHQYPGSGESGIDVQGMVWIKGSEIYTYDPDSMETNDTVGDLNGDGFINIYDYSLLQRYLSGTVELTDKQLNLADTNNDGKADAADLQLIDDYINGIITVFPINSDSDSDTASDTETETDTASDTDSGIDTDTDTDTQIDTNTDTASDTDTSSDSDTDTASDTDTNSDVATDSDTDQSSDTETDPVLRDKKASYVYDKLGRVTKVIYDDKNYVKYTYDKNGNITDVNAVENVGQ